jgi:hypothetical protein
MRAARVALLVLVATVPGLSELLPVHHPCPDSVPAVVCFGHTAASRATHDTEWLRDVDLPLVPTRAYVQSLLQTCLEVEHSTIPLYLTTMYSIIDQQSFEAKTMRSVVMEEMLHMVNAANVLNAIGGAPSLDHPGFIPTYPLTLPVLNMSADVVWFTSDSIQHYQILESTPPGGISESISAAYLHIVNLLTALVNAHGEEAVFSGNSSLQVEAFISSGQAAHKVYTLKHATNALLGVADQGGGCPIKGHTWPETSSILAGNMGGNYSHAARYQEILDGRSYQENDTVGHPTGKLQQVEWHNVRRFAPNPTTKNFDPDQCVDGGSWVVRNDSFFVETMWQEHSHQLDTSIVPRWQDCAAKCVNWTINFNQPLKPCAMWSWNSASNNVTVGGGIVPAHACLLAQGGGPKTAKSPGFRSGCQYGTVCNHSLPHQMDDNANADAHKRADPPSPSLAQKCAALAQRGLEFAGNYTALLVQLHNVFNGQPNTLDETIGAM